MVRNNYANEYRIMPAAEKVEHAQIQVENLEESLEFYTSAMGLVELSAENGVTYLGAGRDGNYDLAITEGSPGIEHYAIRVPDEETIEAYKRRLEGIGVESKRTDREEPNQEHGLRFRLPSGVQMEFVTTEDRDYQHSDEAMTARGGAAPLDIHHITYLTPNLKDEAEFFTEVLDFKLTEVVGTESEWQGAFLRRGDFHHDVAFFSFPGSKHVGLHHLAWKFTSIEHMKFFIDSISSAGVGLEFGIGRHYGGDGIYSYFLEPGGNRFELTTEMASIDTDTTRYTSPTDFMSAWGEVAVPDSFESGSGYVP